jgi:hypothetical protein
MNQLEHMYSQTQRVHALRFAAWYLDMLRVSWYKRYIQEGFVNSHDVHEVTKADIHLIRRVHRGMFSPVTIFSWYAIRRG